MADGRTRQREHTDYDDGVIDTSKPYDPYADGRTRQAYFQDLVENGGRVRRPPPAACAARRGIQNEDKPPGSGGRSGGDVI